MLNLVTSCYGARESGAVVYFSLWVHLLVLMLVTVTCQSHDYPHTEKWESLATPVRTCQKLFTNDPSRELCFLFILPNGVNIQHVFYKLAGFCETQTLRGTRETSQSNDYLKIWLSMLMQSLAWNFGFIQQPCFSVCFVHTLGLFLNGLLN